MNAGLDFLRVSLFSWVKIVRFHFVINFERPCYFGTLKIPLQNKRVFILIFDEC